MMMSTFCFTRNKICDYELYLQPGNANDNAINLLRRTCASLQTSYAAYNIERLINRSQHSDDIEPVYALQLDGDCIIAKVKTINRSDHVNGQIIDCFGVFISEYDPISLGKQLFDILAENRIDDWVLQEFQPADRSVIELVKSRLVDSFAMATPATQFDDMCRDRLGMLTPELKHEIARIIQVPDTPLMLHPSHHNLQLVLAIGENIGCCPISWALGPINVSLTYPQQPRNISPQTLSEDMRETRADMRCMSPTKRLTATATRFLQGLLKRR